MKSRIHVSDGKLLFRMRRGRILLAASACGIVVALALGILPLQYRAKGVFVEAEHRSSIMLSRLLLKNVVQECHLQCELEYKSVFSRLVRGLRRECGLSATEMGGAVGHVAFHGVRRIAYPLVPISPTEYTLGEHHGIVGEPLSFPDGTITIEALPKEEGMLTFFPIDMAIDRLALCINEKGNVLTCTYPDRIKAMAILDALMAGYKRYLTSENEEETAYLNRRREALVAEMEGRLKEHKAHLEKEIGEQGFLGSLQELIEKREAYTSQLAALATKIERLSQGELPESAQEVHSRLVALKREVSRRWRPSSPYDIVGLPQRGQSRNMEGLDLMAAKELYAKELQERRVIEEEIEQLEKLFLLKESISLESLAEKRTMSDIRRLAQRFELVKKRLEAHIRAAQRAAREKHARVSRTLIELYDVIAMLSAREIRAMESDIKHKREQSIKELFGERTRLQGKLNRVICALRTIPEKWLREKRLMFATRIAEGVTERIESKNSQYTAANVRAKPLGPAYAPEQSLPPFIIEKGIAAFLLAGIALFAFSFARALARKKLPCSLDHLREKGVHISGTLSRHVKEEEMGTLRTIASYIDTHRTVALIMGRCPNYSYALAALIAKQEKRLLLIQSYFTPLVQTTDVPGLAHYLSGEVAECPIRTLDGYDYLPMGEQNPFGTELLRTPSFARFLEEMRARYDQVILFSKAGSLSPEAHAVAAHADAVALSIDGESLDMLKPCLEWGKNRALTIVSCSVY